MKTLILLFDKINNEYIFRLLESRDSEGFTPLMNASFYGKVNSLKYILGHFDNMDNKFAAISLTSSGESSGSNSVNLASSADSNREEIIEALLDNLNQNQKNELLNAVNANGNTAVMESYQRGYQPTVTFLIDNGAQLPRDLSFIFNNNRLDDRQSTHTASVHQSVSNSAIALAARYLDIPKKSKETLINWLKSSSNNNDNNDIQHEFVCIMRKPDTKEAFEKLFKDNYDDIFKWSGKLPSNHLNDKAKLGLNRIFGRISNYRDSKSFITIMQATILIWKALNDSTIYSTQEQINNNLNKFKQHLFETQREYNLNNNGIDLEENHKDKDRPACAGGAFNKVISSGFTLHPDIIIKQVRFDTIFAKADILLSKYFGLSTLSSDEIKELESNFIVYYTYNLPGWFANIYKQKLKRDLQAEFGEFEKLKLIANDTIDRAITKVLEFPGAISGPKIVRLLTENANKTKKAIDANNRASSVFECINKSSSCPSSSSIYSRSSSSSSSSSTSSSPNYANASSLSNLSTTEVSLPAIVTNRYNLRKRKNKEGGFISKNNKNKKNKP